VKRVDELRRKYDLSQLNGAIWGKYYRRASVGTNIVLIEPDLATIFSGQRGGVPPTSTGQIGLQRLLTRTNPSCSSTASYMLGPSGVP
jgi:hypothetical protein